MKLLKYSFITAIVLLILWIVLPRAIPIKFTLFNQNIDVTIRPLTITTTVNGQRVQKEFKTQLGLDLKGGSHLVFEADTAKVDSADLEDALRSARDIVERRVNTFGVAEPSIRTIKAGDIYRITVDLPGVQDVSQAVALIGQTAQLQFKEMGGEIDPAEATTTPIFLLLTKETGLTGKDVKKATVTFNQSTGEPQVLLEFSEKGRQLFADITQRNIGQPVGIFIDEFIISAPTVQAVITEGNAVISGQFTTDTAKQLATAINSGALPLPIKLVEQRNI
ncbi:MAG TPA: hypothetical protein PLS49_01175, partial [Candidatus Woesebacteria bacterium]|nr:hypothetical protein [Candidatus Woesebacteria bacterium]